LFLDICKFSQIPNYEPGEQDNVLKVLNLFMAEMLQVVKMHNGEFEKNTGDGLMAYFADASEAEAAKRALDAAITMHCYNDQVISPRLEAMGLQKVKFRVGIEQGTVTVANVGIHGGSHRSLVAIGSTANVACKLMALIQDGGIVIGNRTKSLLPQSWQAHTTSIGPLPAYVIRGTETPYPAWEVTYRVPDTGWAAAVTGLGGLGGLY
jgi:class 3 adenylate cyclase